MKKIILFSSIICASGLTLVSIYNNVIDAQSWASDIPASIQLDATTFNMSIHDAFSLSSDRLTKF